MAQSLKTERNELLNPSTAAKSSDRERASGFGDRAMAAPASAGSPPSVSQARGLPRKRSRKESPEAIDDLESGHRAEVGGAESAGGAGGSPTTGRGAGVLKKGQIFSLQDGRPLVHNTTLMKSYPNNYRCQSNTRRWNGHKLDLGQGFKLACSVHNGPRMPYEKKGDFETSKALFLTAAS